MAKEVLQKSQPGLFFEKPNFGIFINAWYKEDLNVDDSSVRDGIVNAARDVVKHALDVKGRSGARTRAIVVFNPKQWKEWFKDDPKLKGLGAREGKYLDRSSEKFLDTGGDVYFVLKSDDSSEVLEKLLKTLKSKMKKFCGDNFDIVKSKPSTKQVIQSSFTEGIANKNDAESFRTYIVKNEGSFRGYPGSTYLLTQQFEFNWTVLGSMDKADKEDMIGRKIGEGGMIPRADAVGHIHRAHVVHRVPPLNALERHPRIFRFSMPYGEAHDKPGREEGVMYLQIGSSIETIETLLRNIAGNDKHAEPGDVTVDTLISAVKPLQGSFWYVPSAEELNLPPLREDRFALLDFWNKKSPTNEYLFYNQKEYMYRMTTGGYAPGDPPSDRVLRLLDYAFQQWNDQWFKRREMPKFPHLFDTLKSHKKLGLVKNSSVMIRKGWAMKVCLARLFSTNKKEKLEQENESEAFFGRKADFFGIHPDELIVGRMPPCFSLGLGQTAMPYLRDEETMPAFVKGLSEAAGYEHVIPDYETLLKKGLQKMKQDMKANVGNKKEEKEFVQACILALEGVQKYIRNYGFYAGYLANRKDFQFSDAQRENLKQVETRMKKIATDRPETFIEAVQLLFSYHCCLHLTGEPTSLGRLDQLLEPFLGETPADQAQEIIDCMFVKLCEHVNLNSSLLNDLYAWGTLAVVYSSNGTFPHGGGINQWVQQATVGGYKANDERVPQDGCNAITIMCLKASRRLPLNAPCLSLRVHKNMPKQVLQEAAKAILSGGAHPILHHDDRLVEGLIKTGTPDVPVSLKKARNYACDGCYEPIFPGETDFSLNFIPLLRKI